MKNRSLHLSLAAGGILFAVLALIYGSYLPMAKSRRYIAAIRQLPSIRSLTEFKNTYDAVFGFPSPVGAEEIGKFTGYDVLNIIQQPGQPEDVFRSLVEYLEPHMMQNNVRHLLALSQMYQTLWHQYGKAEYFTKAEEYYRAAMAIGPKLPPVLYGLANLYAEKGDFASANVIGAKIIELWPEAAKSAQEAPPEPAGTATP